MLVKIHPDFKLQGISYDYFSLLVKAKDFIANGSAFEKLIGTFLLEWLNNEAFILTQTSGSTGMPKKIALLKKDMLLSAESTGSFFSLHSKSTALLAMSPQYIGGKMMLVRAMHLGWYLDYCEPQVEVLLTIQKKYDFTAFVPLQVSGINDKITNFKKIIIGGAKLNNPIKEDLKKYDSNIFETYGMTETISHIAVKNIKEDFFKALPSVKLFQDERGCLIIQTPYNNNELIVTNDLINLNSENEFEWLGRIDFVINSGGIKLFPELLEEKINLNYRFFISSLPDEKLGEKLILIVECDKNTDLKIDFSKMTKYEIPKEIYYIAQFIETSSGKINRVETMKLIVKKSHSINNPD